MPRSNPHLGPAGERRAAAMPRVRYAPVHPNPHEAGALAGRGAADVTWVLGDPGPAARAHGRPALAFLHDTRLEPHAAVGLHPHTDTEEAYYVLEGTLTVTREAQGLRHTATLGPGDAHLVRPGEQHAAEAGPDGCRMIVVAARAAP